MAMKNYRVEYEDGSESWYQFDDSEDAGKAGLEAFKNAAKSAESPVKNISAGDPPSGGVVGVDVQKGSK